MSDISDFDLDAHHCPPRLLPSKCRRLHEALDGCNEGSVLHFIHKKYGAKSLLYLRDKQADAILDRTPDFLATVEKIYPF